MTDIRIGAATVDLAARTIGVNENYRRVSPKATAVLSTLIDAKGAIVSREALLSRVWPDIFVGEEVLTQAIAELRRAFGDKPRDARYIETLPKSGYRLSPDLFKLTTTSAFLVPPGHNDSQAFISSLTSYLSACEAFDKGGRSNIDAAIALCKESLEYDQEFAPAHAWLSITLIYKQLYYGHGECQLNEALKAARSAILHDRANADGYAAQGLALANLGDFDHAMTSFNAAVRLHVDSFYPLNLFGLVLFSRGAYAAAARLFDRAAALRSVPIQTMLKSAKAWSAAGKEETAIQRQKRALQLCNRRLAEDPMDLRALICKTYCQIGVEGIDSAGALLSLLEDNHDPVTYYLVAALARAGEKKAAIDRFEAIVDNGWADSFYMKFDKDLTSLRGERRFDKIASALAA